MVELPRLWDITMAPHTAPPDELPYINPNTGWSKIMMLGLPYIIKPCVSCGGYPFEHPHLWCDEYRETEK